MSFPKKTRHFAIALLAALAIQIMPWADRLRAQQPIPDSPISSCLASGNATVGGQPSTYVANNGSTYWTEDSTSIFNCGDGQTPLCLICGSSQVWTVGANGVLTSFGSTTASSNTYKCNTNNNVWGWTDTFGPLVKGTKYKVVLGTCAAPGGSCPANPADPAYKTYDTIIFTY